MIRLAGVLLVLLMALAPLVPAPPSHANVRNQAPSSLVIDLSAADADPSTSGIQIAPLAGADRTVTLTFEARDENGHNDLRDASVQILKSDASVHRASSAASKSSGNANAATFTHSFSMGHHDPAGTYTVAVVVNDRAASQAAATVTFTYLALAAHATSATLAVSSSDVTPGGNTSASPATLTITNTGNTRMDIALSGTALAGPEGASLPVSDVRYSLSGTPDALRAGTPLSTTPATLTSFDLDPGSGSSRALHFAIFATPQANLPGGTYTGTMTVTAVAG